MSTPRAVHEAATRNNWEALDVLCKAATVNLDDKDSFGLSALHAAGTLHPRNSTSVFSHCLLPEMPVQPRVSWCVVCKHGGSWRRVAETNGGIPGATRHANE